MARAALRASHILSHLSGKRRYLWRSTALASLSHRCLWQFRDMMKDANSQWRKLEDETGVELLMFVNYFLN